jgi:hypothetical protein
MAESRERVHFALKKLALLRDGNVEADVFYGNAFPGKTMFGGIDKRKCPVPERPKPLEVGELNEKGEKLGLQKAGERRVGRAIVGGSHIGDKNHDRAAIEAGLIAKATGGCEPALLKVAIAEKRAKMGTEWNSGMLTGESDQIAHGGGEGELKDRYRRAVVVESESERDSPHSEECGTIDAGICP